MAVVLSNPLYVNQVGSNGSQAASSQLNFRQMLMEVTGWNPDLDPQTAGRFINNAYRSVIDRRSWYGLKLRGQISVIAPRTVGQVALTRGSTSVVGSGTAFDQTYIGLQFRPGFTYAYQTIVNVDVANQVLTLDMPYGGASINGGYQVVDAWITMGGNIKRMSWAVNQQQGWPMDVNVPVETLNQWDVWRTNIGWSTTIAVRPPTPDGQYQVEVWPTPFSSQVFPYEAWQQPSDLVLDSDAMVSWIRSDIIVTKAVADALLYRGRASKYYDPTVAGMKLKQFNDDVEKMEENDDNMDLKSVTWSYGEEDGRSGYGPGSTWAQSHP